MIATGELPFVPPIRGRLVGRAARLSGEGRNRTGDTTVFSRVLYRLSYLAEPTESSGRKKEDVPAGAPAP
jgi:hypothetical protein